MPCHCLSLPLLRVLSPAISTIGHAQGGAKERKKEEAAIFSIYTDSHTHKQTEVTRKMWTCVNPTCCFSQRDNSNPSTFITSGGSPSSITFLPNYLLLAALLPQNRIPIKRISSSSAAAAAIVPEHQDGLDVSVGIGVVKPLNSQPYLQNVYAI